MTAIGGHQRSRKQNHLTRSDEWITPKEIIEALGPFDLDPCASTRQPWPTAKYQLTSEDDGLLRPWFGRVWLNPPYGRFTGRWLSKLAHHGDGIALVFARTETIMFQKHVWPKASGLFFVFGRIHFHRVTGERALGSGGPSVLIAYGTRAALTLQACELAGQFVRLR